VKVEPERELVKRVSPFVLPAAVLAGVAGWLIDGSGAAWSAVIAIVIVYLNFVANALSIAWASSVSPTAVSVVALGGYVVRLIIYTVALVLLDKTSWFSATAFIAALIPAVVAVLIYEAKFMTGPMQADLWSFERTERR
jgi:hypothetical protein